MKKLLSFVLLVLLFGRAAAAETPSNHKWLDDGGVAFRENKGQIKDTKGTTRPDVLYTADVNGVRLFFQKNRISYVFPKYSEQTGIDGKPKVRVSELYRMDIELVGANPGVVVKSEIVSQASGYENFYSPKAPQGILNVKAYEKITYQNIYPNIDLVYYTTKEEGGKALKYDFVVHPGGKTSDIRLRYVGADQLNLTSAGNIKVVNPFGSMEEKAPYTFQTLAGGEGKANITSKYKVDGNIVSFDVNRYDQSGDLVIDPLQVVWGTFYGGSRSENANSMVLDKDNNVIFTGSTKSMDFPVTTGGTLKNDYADVYLVKFNSVGVRQWALYYGGSDDDEAIDLFTDPVTGNIALTGATGTIVGPLPEGDLPVTPSAAQSSFGGGRLDAFVLYFNPFGINQWATFLGGGIGGAPNTVQEGEDQGRGIVVNKNGDVTVVGYTICSDFPTAGGGSPNYSYSGGYDAFLARYNKAGNLIWSTWYGGSLDDAADDIAIDDNGNYYVTGYTKSQGFPVAPATFQGACASCPSNLEDAFVLKLNTFGGVGWGTFYGGGIDDRGKSIAVSKDGTNLYVVGYTNSSSGMTTSGVFQPNYGNITDGFVLNINGNTGQRNWSSYLGDASTDYAQSVAIDADGDAYVTGYTISSGFPSKFPLQSAKDNSSDGFLTRVKKDGKSLVFSTFYGGNNKDFINSVAVDNTGSIYIAGQTESTNLQQKNPIFQPTNKGGQDAFVAKLFCQSVPFIVNPPQGVNFNSVCANAGSIVLGSTPGGVIFAGKGIIIPGVGSGEPYRFNPQTAGGPGDYVIKAILPDACNDTTTFNIKVVAVPTGIISGPTTVCKNGQPFNLTVSLSDGSTPTSILWSGGAVIPTTGSFRPDIAVVGSNQVTANIITAQGCTLTVSTTINVLAPPTPTISGLAPSYCALSPCTAITVQPAGGILSGPGVSGTQFCPQIAGPGTHTLRYSVTVNGCSAETTAVVTVNPSQPTTITGVTNGQQFCVNDNGSYTLVSDPPGAIFTNNGVPFNATFSPKTLGVGFYNITATPANGVCATPGNISFSIISATTSSISGLQPSYCELPAETITIFTNPAAGTLIGVPSITGSNGSYSFPKPGVGTYTLTFTPSGCANPTTANFTVTPAPIPIITVGQAPGMPTDTYCKGDNQSYAFTLSLQLAGSYTINGSPVGSLIPSTLVAGQATITFTPFPGVCGRPATKVVTIIDQTPGTLTVSPNKQTYCTTETTPIVFTGTPAGGSYTLNGAPFNGTMNPPFTVGSYTVQYRQGAGVCATDPAPITITIQESPLVNVTMAAGNNFCVTDQNTYPITFTAGSNCNCTGPGVSGNSFRPSMAGAGNHTITCTPAPGSCFRPGTTFINVASEVISSITVPSNGAQFCEKDNTPVQIIAVPSAGAIFTIDGTPNAGSFVPSNLTKGSHVIAVSYPSSSCTRGTQTTITISEAPNAVITPLSGSPFCVTDNTPKPLSATPAGGFFSGPGVIGTNFIPSNAGVGTHQIKYTPTASSCAKETTLTITVNPQTPSSISGITNGQTFCKLVTTPVSITGTPAGGTFTLDGQPLVGSTITMSNLGAGSHILVYTPLAAACASNATINFIVTDAQPTFISGINTSIEYCENDVTPVQLFGNPTGGVFSGNGVNGTNWTPKNAGVGTHTITYTPAPGTCYLPSTIQVRVRALINSSITVPTNGAQYCITDNTPVTLVSNPLGALFTIDGNPTGNQFVPSSLSLGNHIFKATYPASACTNPSTITITITDAPGGTFSGIDEGATFCITDNTPKALLGTPAGGTFSGPGVNGTNFTPSNAGVGTHTITYNPSTGSCAKPVSKTVKVIQQISATISGVSNAPYCAEDATPITLVGTPAPGKFFNGTTEIVGNTISPKQLGSGFFVIRYEPSAEACAFPASVQIVVQPAQKATITGVDISTPYCITDSQPKQLIGNPVGGTFVGNGVNGTTWTPSVAGVGTHTIIYNPPAPNPSLGICHLAETLTVTVRAQQSSMITVPQSGSQYCVTDTRQILFKAEPIVLGMVFKIDGQPKGDFFVPAGLALGEHTVTVEYPASACVAGSSIKINITDSPNGSLSGITNGQTFCITDSKPYTLTSSPAGGIFSGNGVSGTTFTPSSAGVGTFTISVNFPPEACAKPASATITVKDLITSSFTGITPNNVYCSTDNQTYQLVGNPAGGVFKLNGSQVVTSINPSQLAEGFYTLTYEPSQDGCALPSTQSFSVKKAPDAIISGIVPGTAYCTTDQNSYQLFATPAEGQFSGPGVSGNQFRPLGLNGDIQITFTPNPGVCALPANITVKVNKQITAQIGGLPGTSLCATSAPVSLTGTPEGGQFYFNGTPSGNILNPSIYASMGTVQIEYRPGQTSCATSAFSNVIISPAPQVTVTMSPNNGNDVCRDQTPFTVSGSPAGGTFTIDGAPLTGNPATVIPANYAQGTRTIVYSGSSGACQYAETLKVVFNNPPLVQIGGLEASPFCPTVNQATPIFGTPAGGTFSGPGVNGNSFNPSIAGSGTHTITYSGVYKGCSYTTSTTVTVAPKFDVKLFGMAKSYCISDVTRYTFTAEPKGGTWAGQGLNQQGNDAVFIPRNSRYTPGMARIEYWGEYNGCPYYKDTLIEIIDSSPSSFSGLNTSYCASDNNTYTLTGTPPGGTFTGKGIVNGNQFKPSEAGFGFFEITYTPPTTSLCYSTSKAFVTVTPNSMNLSLQLQGQGQNTVAASVDGATGNVTYTLNGGAPTPNNVFTNLAPGSYTICAKDDAGCTDCQTININTQSCDCPSNITVSNVTISGAVINWVTNPSATSYRIRYRKSGDVNYIEAGNSTTNSFSLTGLEGSLTYDIVVNSICANGVNSQDCNTTVTTFDCKAPDFFEAREINASTATVEWDEVLGSVGYEIQYKAASEPESAWRPVPATFVPYGTLSYQFKDLNVATDYVARLRTVCSPGEYSPLVFTFFTTENIEGPAQVDIRNVVCEGNEVVATVEWTPVPNAFGYRIEYRIAGTQDVPVTTTVDATVTSTKIRGFAQNQSYELWVRTVGQGGNSFSAPTASNQPFFTTPTCGGSPCPAPTAVNIEVITNPGPGNSEATISWEPVANATSYVVEYQVSGSGLVVTPVNDITLDITGLDCGNGDFDIRVKAICSGQESPYATARLTFDANKCGTVCPIPQLKPTVVYKDVNDYAVQMRWFTVKVDGHYYEVQYAKINEEYGPALPVNPDPVNDTMYYHISKLECPQNYKFRVRTVCFDGSRSDWAETTFVIDLCNQGQCPVPQMKPTVVYKDVNDYAVQMRWFTVKVEGHYYEVQYAKTNEEYGPALPVNPDPVNDTMYYHISKLTCPADYKFRVRTVCFDGSQSAWVETTFRIDLCNQEGCPAPTNVRTDEISLQTATITFNRVAQAVNGYILRYRPVGNGNYITQNVAQTSTPDVKVVLNNLIPETEYEFDIQSLCSNSTSDRVNGRFITVDCQSPFRFDVTDVTTNSVSVEWDLIPGSLGYQVEIRNMEDPIYDGTRLYNVGPTVNSYTFTGLASGRRYEVRIRSICVNDKSFSPWTYNTATTNTGGGNDCQAIMGNIDVSQIEATFAAVSWLASGGVQGYRLEYRKLGQTNWVLEQESENPYAFIQGLASCTDYQLQVSVICLDGKVSAPVVGSFRTSCTVTCSSVQNLRAIATGTTSVSVNWNPPSGVGTVENYAVQYRELPNGIAQPAYPGIVTTATTISIPGLKANTQYEIIVRVKCTGGPNDYSDPVTTIVVTNPEGGTCICPSNISATAITNTSTTITWTASAGATGYTVRFNNVETPVSGTSFNLSNLTPGTNYVVEVRTICANGNSTYCSAPFTTTGATGCQGVDPITIGQPVFTVLGDKVTLSFAWGAAPDAAEYIIRYRKVGDISYTEVTTTNTNITIEGLAVKTQYEVQIVTRCSDGSTSVATILPEIVTPGPGTCLDVENITINADVTTATFEWTPVSNAKNYVIQYRRALDNPDAWLKTDSTTHPTVTYTATELEPGTNYVVRVMAKCLNGGSSNWTTRPFSTLGGDCIVPELAILSGLVTCNKATVTWSTSPFAQEYEIETKEGAGPWSAPITSQGSQFELTNLKENLPYAVRIRAICANGSLESEFDTITFNTPPCVSGFGSMWQVTTGGQGWDEAHSVAATTDGGYIVTGYTFSWGAGEWDVYLAKFNQFGGKIWDKTYGTPNRDEGRSVIATSDGGYLIAGYTDGKSTGEADMYVIKTNDIGDVIWERSYGAANYTVGYDIRETSNGYILAGTAQEVGAGRNIQMIKLDNNGGIEWQKSYGGSADEYGFGVTNTKDGGFAVVGYTQSMGNGVQDILVIKTSQTGAVQWAKTVGGGGRDYGYGIAEDNSGNIVVTGYTKSYNDILGDVLISKFDASGNPVWTKTYGNTSFDFANNIIATKDGHYVITGGNAMDNTNATFIKVDDTGKLIASQRYGSDKTDQGRTVIESADGGFVIAGQSNSFETGMNAQVYLIKTDPMGNSCPAASQSYAGISVGTPNTPTKDVTTEVTNSVIATSYTVTSSSGSIVGTPLFKVNAICAAAECSDVINLAVLNPKGSTAEVVWTPVGLPLYFELRYKSDMDVDFSPYIKVIGTSYKFGAIAPNTNYTVEVRAVCVENSSQSVGQSVDFNSGVLKSDCKAPTNVNITQITKGSAVVNWTAIPNVSGYVVSYREMPGNNTYITTFVPVGQSSYTLTGLKNSTTYNVRVLTVCLPGDNSPFTLEIPFTTLANKEASNSSLIDLSLYPNPTRGEVNIRFNTVSMNPATIYVMDVTGRSIVNQTIVPIEGENEVRVDLTGNAAGVYLLRFMQGDVNRTVKVVVE